MPTSATSHVIQHLRRAVLLQDGAGRTDGELLDYFIEQHDDAAGRYELRSRALLPHCLLSRHLANLRRSRDGESRVRPWRDQSRIRRFNSQTRRAARIKRRVRSNRPSGGGGDVGPFTGVTAGLRVPLARWLGPRAAGFLFLLAGWSLGMVP